jgi:hypothetical protein
MGLFLERTAILQNQMAIFSAQMAIFLERMAMLRNHTAISGAPDMQKERA